MELINFDCASCGMKFRVSADKPGRKGKCPRCPAAGKVAGVVALQRQHASLVRSVWFRAAWGVRHRRADSQNIQTQKGGNR